MTARAPQRSQRSAGDTGAAVKLVVVLISSIKHPNRPEASNAAPVCRFPHRHGRMTGMSQVTSARPRADIQAPHLRKDRWWIQPLVIAVGFTAFVVYSTWAAFN